jgi:hypothetical protein
MRVEEEIDGPSRRRQGKFDAQKALGTTVKGHCTRIPIVPSRSTTTAPRAVRIELIELSIKRSQS